MFLTKICDAVIECGEDRIVNMDETFVTTSNLQTPVIGLKGKERKVFIGTAAMNLNIKIPLGLISKGKTKRCEKKYGEENVDELITHSNNGWMTPTVMKTLI